MVSISAESAAETDQRLRAVIAAAELVVHDGSWQFRESPLAEPPELGPEVLAVVRDEHTWSRLVPAEASEPDTEVFGLVSFHFPGGIDNSGFVGWLAGTLKARLGTGVFVVCGYNSGRGGVFDYTGFPIAVRDDVLRVIRELRA
ncbi:DUF6196 family protein [Amycolatopsis palatopharyngis]|uniref:DUF6196 family protein n=1 Tax=Amycolatopsis palatopharyngis TaxID=187982 RepID=UPI000E23FF56|nr:DUF6196 family protein [Amycolatopsis palatopharyngis]